MASLPTSIAVIGGGLIGLASAVRLAEAGLAVTLIDPDPSPQGASWGNAGHIAVEQVEPLASPATVRGVGKRLFLRGGALDLPLRDAAAWAPFAWRLLRASTPARFAAGKAALSALLAEAMPAWLCLADAAGAGDLVRQDGHFIVWETPETAAEGRARWLAADTGTATVRDATAAERAALATLTTAPVAGAVRVEGSGQVTDLAEMARRLADRLEALGGRRIAAQADGLRRIGNRAHAMLADGPVVQSDLILIAAGAASGRLLATLGRKVPLIAERGYHIQSAHADDEANGWPADLPPVVWEDRSMIATRFKSGLRAASFVEFGRAESPPDPRKWARLRAHVAALGLPFAMPGAEWMGARPTLPDYLPAIGRGEGTTNLLYAFGHQHLGLTLAAVTADAVAALATGREPAVGLAPFSLARFGAQP